MKNIMRVFILATVMFLTSTFMVKAQWGDKSPSERTLDEIQMISSSSGEVVDINLRARPIDETPIGGVNASLPEASVSVLAFALGFYVLLRRRKVSLK